MGKNDKNKIRALFLMGAACLCLAFGMPFLASATEAIEEMGTTADERTAQTGPEVVETYTNTENPCITWYVRGVAGKLKSETAYVGTKEVTVSESGMLGDEGGYAPKTLILLDNSDSLKKYKSGIEDILVRLIWNHQNAERFSIVTFNTEEQVVLDYTDNYDELRIAAEGIAYKNQKTYLRNVLYDEIKKLSLDKKNNYNRIILFSDATDDSILGVTYEELIDLLSDDSTSIPIYTVGCTYKQSQGELDKLFALSRRTGSPYFLMDDYKEATDIADVIGDDGKSIRYFSFDLAAEQRDGSDKSISLLLEDENGEHLLTHVSHIQLASVDELKELEKEREEAIAAATEAETEEAAEEETEIPIEAEGTESTEESTEAETESQETSPMTSAQHVLYYLTQNGLWLTLLLLLALAAYVRFAGVERKKNSGAFVEADGYEGEGAAPDQTRGITTGILLSNIGAGDVKYTIRVGESRVIGRLRSRCDIAFPEDRSMSARQAVIHVRADQAVLENLDTQRGSLVDGEMISGSMALKNGSRIRIGNTELRVTYE